MDDLFDDLFDGYFVCFIWERDELWNSFIFQYFLISFVLKRSRCFKTNYWKLNQLSSEKEEESQNEENHDDVSKGLGILSTLILKEILLIDV